MDRVPCVNLTFPNLPDSIPKKAGDGTQTKRGDRKEERDLSVVISLHSFFFFMTPVLVLEQMDVNNSNH